jgi:hypothetical protein
MIQCAVSLYNCERMVIPEHQGHRRQPDLLGTGRHITQRGEGIPVPRTAPPGFVGGDADVLTAREMVVAKPIRRLGHAADGFDRGVLLPRQRRTGDIRDDGRGDGEFQ